MERRCLFIAARDSVKEPAESRKVQKYESVAVASTSHMNTLSLRRIWREWRGRGRARG